MRFIPLARHLLIWNDSGRKETISVGGIDIFVLSRDDLIKNKKASGRSMDIADADKLEKNTFKTRKDT